MLPFSLTFKFYLHDHRSAALVAGINSQQDESEQIHESFTRQQARRTPSCRVVTTVCLQGDALI